MQVVNYTKWQASLLLTLQNISLPGAPKNIDSSKAVLKDTIAIKKYAGSYISDDGLQINFRLSNKKLYADTFGRTFLLTKGERDSFSLFIDPGVKFLFNGYATGDTTVFAAFSPR